MTSQQDPRRTPAGGADPRRWQALAVVGTAFLMTIMDASIVNVALPSIQQALGFSRESVQWLITAYAIPFGGLLLLAGRTADLLGRRRLFLTGMALFTSASLLAGRASAPGVLIGARAAQGVGAAIVSPTALAIVTTAFPEGPERNRALGVWGALGGTGAAIGVIAGGAFTQWLGWEWIFSVNVPIGIAVLALALRIVRESRAHDRQRRADLPSAAAVTAGLTTLVFAISKAPDVGWATPRTIAPLAAAAALLAFFLVREARARAPLVPPAILQIRSVATANLAGLFAGSILLSSFFLLTLYLQRVLDYSPLNTGLAFLITTGTTVVVSGLAQALTTRLGPRAVMSAGFLLWGVAIASYAQISPHGGLTCDLLPGFLLLGFGLPFTLVPISVAALSGVEGGLAGLASGLITTSQQLGGAMGVAIASTVATSHTTALLGDGQPAAAALTRGLAVAFWVIAALAGAGLLVALALVPRRP